MKYIPVSGTKSTDGKEVSTGSYSAITEHTVLMDQCKNNPF